MSIKPFFFFCNVAWEKNKNKKNIPTRLAASIFYIFGCCGFQDKI